MAFNSGATAAYIEQNRDELVSLALQPVAFEDYITTIDGVRNEYKLPMHDATINRRLGLTSAPITTGVTNGFIRTVATLDPSFSNVEDEFDLRTLRNSVLSNSLTPGTQNETFSFWNQHIDQVIRKINIQREVDFLLANASTTDQEQNGIFRTSGTVNLSTATTISASNYKETIAGLMGLIPAAYRGEDLVMFCSYATLDAIVQGMTADGNRYLDPTATGNALTLTYPIYPNLTIVGLAGLGTQARVLVGPQNLIYQGVDTYGSVDGSNVWFSQDDNAIKYRFEWSSSQVISVPGAFATNNVALT